MARSFSSSSTLLPLIPIWEEGERSSSTAGFLCRPNLKPTNDSSKIIENMLENFRKYGKKTRPGKLP